MDHEPLLDRSREFERYLGWDDDDSTRIRELVPILEPHLHALIDDFYEQVDRHDATRKVIVEGAEQIKRLKGTLLAWLRELLSGHHDLGYFQRRWNVGRRHVAIGLDQAFTSLALSRLRTGMTTVILRDIPGDWGSPLPWLNALNKRIDLDLAIIEDAYQLEYAQRLQRAERLATLGQIAGGVAHELRNPLNVVKTSVYFLLHAKSTTAEKTAVHLQRIERQVELADNVITALSNFAKLPVPILHPIPLPDVIADALENNPPGPQIEVTVDLEPGLPAVLADRDQLGIVFGNLIRNARDAMDSGGRLGISARMLDNSVRVDVSDTGVGIPKAELAKIMEPLYSTKTRGLGLGLAITRSILEKSRASLSVTSELGQGSTFSIEFLPAPGEDPQS